MMAYLRCFQKFQNYVREKYNCSGPICHASYDLCLCKIFCILTCFLSSKKVYILHPDIKFTTVPNLTRIRRQSESLSCALHNFYDLGDKPFRTSVSKDASRRYDFIICWLKTLIRPYNFVIINVMVCCDCFTYHIMGVGLSI